MSMFSDEDLTAYLDGEADAEQVRLIDAELERNPDLADRLTGLEIDTGKIKAAFDDLLKDAPQAPIEASHASSVVVPLTPPSLGWMKMAAAALLALGLGWLVGQSGRSELDAWQDYAAAYHKLYTQETLSGTRFPEEVLDAQLAAVSEAIGMRITRADLERLDGLELRRAQVLGFEDAKIAHIAMQDAQGRPVALCITNIAETGTVDLEETMGMATARWGSGTHSYYLIGGRDKTLVESAAKTFAAL